MLAAKRGDLKATEALLDAKANVQATNVMLDHFALYGFIIVWCCLHSVLIMKKTIGSASPVFYSSAA